jgi:hypothetical protein
VRVWVVAAVICSSLLATATTVVLLSGANSDLVAKGSYADLWIMPYPGDAKSIGTPYPAEGNLDLCPHQELRNGPDSCIQLSDSTIYDVLGSQAWPASTRASGCTTGWVLKVNLVDGTHLSYGPCAPYPPSIVQLREWLLEHFASP